MGSRGDGQRGLSPVEEDEKKKKKKWLREYCGKNEK